MIELKFDKARILEAARIVVNESGGEKFWIFQGEMGAGKTTLIKALGSIFDITDSISSPTFGIVNEYSNEKGDDFYHFDFYRLDDSREALDIGIEEYFYNGNYCWLEWAEKVAEFLPDQYFLIKLEILSTTERKLTLQHIRDAS